MALPQRSIGKARHRMVLLGLTAITLVSLDLSSFGPLGTAQRVVRDVLDPIADVAATVASPFANAWNAIFDYDDLQEQNRLLTERIQELEGNELAVEAERAAFERLQDATNITFRLDVESATATVIRGAVGNFDDHVITIDKGTGSGIQEDMAVVTSAGLVGRVERADGSTATVQLLSDTSLVVGVRLASTDEVGLGHTVDGEPDLFRIDQGLDWPDEDDARPLPEIGTVVVTAAISKYPAEIPIGRIVAVYPKAEDPLSMVVDVELANDVTDLGFVTVLLAESLDQIEERTPVPSTTVPLSTDGEPVDADDGAEVEEANP
ncbi:MAG: rod shape-determining protein MreC [Actinomycetota bacterium]